VNDFNRNPYAPPAAAVADVVDADDMAFQPVKIFSRTGRIGRLRYLAYLTGGYLVFTFMIGIVSVILAGAVKGLGLPAIMLSPVPLIAIAFFAGFTILCGIQRSHDMNWPGWTALLLLIPPIALRMSAPGRPGLNLSLSLISLVLALIWTFVPGTKGPNRFGPPPVPNTLGVKILGLLLPVIAVIGILAAIAIPQYQNYVKRAQATQSGR
jgi:uncharacterized membrane protein YhaH (DUF805 family)